MASMKKRRTYVIGTLICVLLWGAVFCGMRGSFQLYPLHISFAYFCDHPFYNRLGINPVFNIIQSAEHGEESLPAGLAEIDEQEALQYVQESLHFTPADPERPLVRNSWSGQEQQNQDKKQQPLEQQGLEEGQKQDMQQEQGLRGMPNVVLVLMESMAAVNMERTNEKGEYLTPYLRSLREKSVFCANAYSAGIHTNNGIVASQYGFVPNFAKAMMSVNAPRFTGLPYYLAQAGYENIAFVTGNPQYDNMNAFWRDNSITEIYSQYDYPREARVNNFGVPDRYMFEWGLNKLNEKEKDSRIVSGTTDKTNRHDMPENEHRKEEEERGKGKFFATFLTVSNHMPYVIPEEFAERGETDEERSIACADDAIRRFMEAAQATEWGKDALFILVADHGIAYGSLYDMGLHGNKIPIFFVHPELKPQVIEKPVSQIDIPETVLNLLGIAHENNGLGIDFLHESRPYAFFVSNEHLGVADEEYFYCYSIQTGRECLYRIGSGDNLAESDRERTAAMRQYGMAMERVNLMAIEKKWTEPQR